VYLGDSSTYGCYNNLAALRFSNVPVPPGANIVKAWIRFRSNGPGTGAADKYIRIQAEKVSNPGTFSTSTSSTDSPYNRKASSPLTDVLEWNSIETWTAGWYYNSADIRTIVQQLVSPSNNWAAGAGCRS
jgi:hypothetical protein